MRVKLQDIVDALSIQFEEQQQFLNLEAFCLQLPLPKSEAFLNAIRGRGAFRRFRDMREHYGILEQWYNYEQQSLIRSRQGSSKRGD